MNDDLSQSWREHWDFAPPLYMNHGSFGLTPKAINDLKSQYEAEMNRDRDVHFWITGNAPMEQARLAVADFVNAPPDDLVLVDNVTEALNTVLKSLAFQPGDEIIITSHGYPPYSFLFDEFCHRTGVKLAVADIPFPVTAEADIVKIITNCVTDKTKLAIIDHITSPTAIILPIAAIVRSLERAGVDTYVDGAHGIGQIALDMQEIGAAYYTSNNHKWLGAPIGSGFLYVRPDRQDRIIPAIGSLWADSGHTFVERFKWQGTKDPCARLCLPETIRYIGSLHPDGWPGIMKRNRALALAARDLVCDRLGLTPACPPDLIACMFSLPLGDLIFPPELEASAPHLRIGQLMRERFGYGVKTEFWGGRHFLRLTAYLYNSLDDYKKVSDDLATVLHELSKTRACG